MSKIDKSIIAIIVVVFLVLSNLPKVTIISMAEEVNIDTVFIDSNDAKAYSD